jgi:hypothetical protein
MVSIVLRSVQCDAAETAGGHERDRGPRDATRMTAVQLCVLL